MFFETDSMPVESTEGIDDMAVVLSACWAIKRLLETLEEEASGRLHLASRLRHVITTKGARDDWPGKACAMPVVMDFLLAVTEETETSESLAARVRASLLKSILGVGLREDS